MRPCPCSRGWRYTSEGLSTSGEEAAPYQAPGGPTRWQCSPATSLPWPGYESPILSVYHCGPCSPYGTPGIPWRLGSAGPQGKYQCFSRCPGQDRASAQRAALLSRELLPQFACRPA